MSVMHTGAHYTRDYGAGPVREYDPSGGSVIFFQTPPSTIRLDRCAGSCSAHCSKPIAAIAPIATIASWVIMVVGAANSDSGLEGPGSVFYVLGGIATLFTAKTCFLSDFCRSTTKKCAIIGLSTLCELVPGAVLTIVGTQEDRPHATTVGGAMLITGAMHFLAACLCGPDRDDPVAGDSQV